MKVAVTAQGTTLQDQVDQRFGRAAYILIIDMESGAVEVINNASNRSAFKGAGIQAAAVICDKKAEVLLTGYCGPNAFKALQAGGVKIINDISGTVSEVLESFTRGTQTFSKAPNTEGHW